MSPMFWFKKLIICNAISLLKFIMFRIPKINRKIAKPINLDNVIPRIVFLFMVYLG